MSDSHLPLQLNRRVVSSPFAISSAQIETLLFSLLRVGLATAILSMLLLRGLMGAPATNHFSFLANAFLHGSWSVGALPESYADTIKIGDQTFLPMGPAPGFLMMPFVALGGVAFDEFWLSLLATVLNAWLLWRILERIGIVDSTRRRWLLLLFFTGTIYLAAFVLGRSWFLAHLVTTLFLFAAIHETLRKGSAFAVGLLLGLSFLTRATTIFGLPFFLLLMWQEERIGFEEIMRFARRILPLAVGLAGPLLFFFIYNYGRFGNPFDTGYSRALPSAGVLQDAMNYGLFSLAHIPKNLYMLLLCTPQPVPGYGAPVLTFPWILPSRWGMGILFTTPAFFYALWADRSQRLVKGAWLAVAAILPFLLLYYGVGYDQFGYRYAIDFYPFLFILAALGIATRFDRTARAWILAGIVVNCWGAWCVLLGSFA